MGGAGAETSGVGATEPAGFAPGRPAPLATAAADTLRARAESAGEHVLPAPTSRARPHRLGRRTAALDDLLWSFEAQFAEHRECDGLTGSIAEVTENAILRGMASM